MDQVVVYSSDNMSSRSNLGLGSVLLHPTSSQPSKVGKSRESGRSFRACGSELEFDDACSLGRIRDGTGGIYLCLG